MNMLKKVLVSPWDFTLYLTNNNKYLIKIMFVEGDYKVDVARYFYLKDDEVFAINDEREMKEITKKIRNSYPENIERELSQSEVKNLTN
ncbi:hypothetical protein [Erwinia mallotivora]|uniref:Uncharacterized protein n=1 Tax=Erwinia mallotivora TaxID=69222 RepID=A0A014NDB3_9GAMM|nr:hypothetical protein [Erwinia mallotivora]EXU77418.1 hypothetical protein BG55_22920 [Erwinia mallotivora]